MTKQFQGRAQERNSREDIRKILLKLSKIADSSAMSGGTALQDILDAVNNISVDIGDIEINTDNIDINTDTLEALTAAITTELQKYGKHKPMSIAGAYEVISVGATVETLTIPVGAVGAVIYVESNSIRVRYDADPTIAIGHKAEEASYIYLGELDDVSGAELTSFKAIAATATASDIFIQYYEKV